MKQQNYANHRMYYAPHHFVLLPLLGFLMIWGGWKWYETGELAWGLFGIAVFCILYLTLMLRQHYALGNQNRIVRLEFRLRYFELTGTSAKAVESRLSFGQIAALRFASDEEFLPLLQQALDRQLNADDIKKQISNWQADTMRI
ncbi:DUF6526 family protein [Rurimicrobium arvi]|uniref:PH domain-containing protein n=1 Tax=Rurimicrobium arvi TaxID=2049916 RepID=A0ABP8MQX1_9BACT